MAAGRVEEAHRAQHPLDLHAGRVERHGDHRVAVVAVGVGVGEPHEDRDAAVGVPDAGAPPLAPVEHHFIAVEGRGRLHVRGVRGGDVGLGHAERRADLAGEQRRQPALVLLGGAEVQQHLHVAGVRRVAVADLARDQRAAHPLGERRVLDVRQSRALRLATDLGLPGRNRFHRPASRAFALSSSMTGSTTHGFSLPSSSRW